MGTGTRLVLAGGTVLLAALPASGQVQWTTVPDEERCERWNRGDDDASHCEVREARLPAAPRIEVDGGVNGGVEVIGSDGIGIGVRARVFSNAGSAERALELASRVRLLVEGGRLRAEGPDTDRGEGWGVSWEVTVPRSTDLDLVTHNGGIGVDGVEGAIEFDAVNGGVHLVAVAGDVRGRTVNGGLHVELTGSTWDGRGLDAETTNGGVTLRVPDGYSADLETGTVNGGIDLDFPVTVRGRIGRRLRATLGDGGPPIRVLTTNGGVRLSRR